MRTVALLVFAACSLQAQNSTQPGRFQVEHPTLLNPGFEWTIDGGGNSRLFEDLTPPDLSQRHHAYHAMDLNFRLKAGSKAVDAGTLLPTNNDDVSGKAPDLGALELSLPASHYGPRWVTWEPFYR